MKSSIPSDLPAVSIGYSGWVSQVEPLEAFTNGTFFLDYIEVVKMIEIDLAHFVP